MVWRNVYAVLVVDRDALSDDVDDVEEGRLLRC